MSIIINVQLSVFCNYRIEPTPENINILLPAINNIGKNTFMPSIITGQNVDLNSKQMKTISNLTFISTDQLYRIVCLDDRLDVVIESSPNSPMPDLQESLDFAKSIMEILLEKFKIIGNRLALNVHVFSDLYKESFAESIYGKNFYTPLDFYKKKDIDEWTTRVNTKIELKIGDKIELSNVITELSIIKEIGTDNRRILCHTDINTLGENRSFRFDSTALVPFSHEAMKIVTEIKSNIEKVDSYEKCD